MRLDLWAALIELAGSIIITGYAVAAVAALRHWKQRDCLHRARLLLSDGVLLGLSLKVAATLLKTLMLRSWSQIGLFATILALRTILKWLFTWERLRASQIT